MSTSGFVDVTQLALGIDLSNPAPCVGEIHTSLRINDNAAARMAYRMWHDPEQRCRQSRKKIRSRIHVQECGAEQSRKLPENCK